MKGFFISTVRRAKLKTSNIGYNVQGNVYVREDLTKAKSQLFAETRKLVKNKVIKSTWTRDGKIFIQPSENARPTQILSLDDINMLSQNQNF